jgi:uncharacterized protein YdeI (YjbR/CyaY-like superfamily)
MAGRRVIVGHAAQGNQGWPPRARVSGRIRLGALAFRPATRLQGRLAEAEEAIDGALCHGWIDGQLQPYDERYWLVRFTPRSERSKWSRLNRARVEDLIEKGRMCAAGLEEVNRAKADGRWDAAYPPQSKAAVPDDLQLALNQNTEAQRQFAKLDSANRYAILYRVHEAKKPETRADRIEKYVRMLARGETIHPRKRTNQ